MDREQLTNLLEAVRSVRAGVFQMEQELLSALSAEQVRRDAPASRGGNTPDEWFTLAELGEWLKVSEPQPTGWFERSAYRPTALVAPPASGVTTWSGGWRTRAEAPECRGMPRLEYAT
jgi:hypothetical protein